MYDHRNPCIAIGQRITSGVSNHELVSVPIAPFDTHFTSSNSPSPQDRAIRGTRTCRPPRCFDPSGTIGNTARRTAQYVASHAPTPPSRNHHRLEQNEDLSAADSRRLPDASAVISQTRRLGGGGGTGLARRTHHIQHSSDRTLTRPPVMPSLLQRSAAPRPCGLRATFC